MEPTDFLSFKKYLAPVLINVMYWVGLLAILILALQRVFNESTDYAGSFRIDWALYAVFLGAASALLWRILCEVWMVMFSINDRLGVISGETPKKTTVTTP